MNESLRKDIKELSKLVFEHQIMSANNAKELTKISSDMSHISNRVDYLYRLTYIVTGIVMTISSIIGLALAVLKWS